MVCVEYVLERGCRLRGAVAGSGRADNLHRLKLVELHHELGPAPRTDRRQRTQGNKFVVTVGHVKLAQIFCGCSIAALCLNPHLPLPAKAIEVVHQRSAHKRLQRLIYAISGICWRHHLGRVYIDANLRYGKQRCGHHARQLRTLFGGGIKICRILRQKINRPPDRSSRMNVNPPELPTPAIAGGGKSKAMPDVTRDKAAARCALIAA